MAISACTIEETPQSYIDNIATPASEVASSREELSDRLLSLAGALERSDQSAVASALAPTNDVVVVGLNDLAGRSTPAGVVAGLLATVDDAEVEAEQPVVGVAPGNDIAWFRIGYSVEMVGTVRKVLRFSGVFLRLEGEWRLTQGHLSTVNLDSPDPDANEQPAAGAG